MKLPKSNSEYEGQDKPTKMLSDINKGYQSGYAHVMLVLREKIQDYPIYCYMCDDYFCSE